MALKCELIKLLEKKKLLYQHYMMRNTILSKLSKQKDYSLIEARSELEMQELRDQCSDRALQESRIQLHAQRMELCHHSQRKKRWLSTEKEFFNKIV